MLSQTKACVPRLYKTSKKSVCQSGSHEIKLESFLNHQPLIMPQPSGQTYETQQHDHKDKIMLQTLYLFYIYPLFAHSRKPKIMFGL